jgi:glycosyltransferase involved in cell wall biosynthesis
MDNGSAYARSIKQLSSGDERIRFAGEFDNCKIPSVHSEIDALIVPSMCYENSPNVILEAFACKTPVVASDHSGMTELVQRGVSGDLFPAGDDRSLAKILTSIVENPSILDEWRLGIPRVKLVEEEIDELEHIYSSVIGGTSRGNYGDLIVADASKRKA